MNLGKYFKWNIQTMVSDHIFYVMSKYLQICQEKISSVHNFTILPLQLLFDRKLNNSEAIFRHSWTLRLEKFQFSVYEFGVFYFFMVSTFRYTLYIE